MSTYLVLLHEDEAAAYVAHEAFATGCAARATSVARPGAELRPVAA